MRQLKVLINGIEPNFPELTLDLHTNKLSIYFGKKRLKERVNNIRDINPNLLKGRISFKIEKSTL